MSDHAILSCHHLGHSFSDGNTNVNVFENVDLSIARGEMVAVVGASGAGKSTLLHLLGGLDQPTSGQVKIDGQRMDDRTERQKSVIRNRSLGFVYQFHHLLPEFNALENVCMPLLIRGVRSKLATSRALVYLDKVGLKARQSHRIGELSGGERQRVAIARALVTEPACVLADEPTGNLDFQTASQIFDLMLELNKALSISYVVVTHNRDLAAQLDKTYLLQGGALQLQT